MESVDDIILKSIANEFKTVKEISEETSITYLRVSVRLRQLRKRFLVIAVESNKPYTKGVRPLMYKMKS